MVVVAIAGGLGDLGRTIVEAIGKLPQHTVFILTRKRSKSTAVPAKVLEIDYSSVDDIASVLETSQIHTVISVVNMDHRNVANSQLNLIRGAEKASTVKRFAPSEFNVDYTQPDSILPYVHKHFFQDALKELEDYTTLEFTLFRNGMFMDYYGLPYTITNLRPVYTIIDIPASKAVIPGDGNSRLTSTYSLDVARGVALSLDLEQWPREISIIGETVTANELVTIAEGVTGRQIERIYVSIDELNSTNQPPHLPSNVEIFASWPELEEDHQLELIGQTLSISMAVGGMEVSSTGFEELVSGFKPLKLKEFFQSTWGNK